MYINALKYVLTWIYCFVNNVAEIQFFFFLSLQRNEHHAADAGGEHHSLCVRSPAGLQYTGQYSRKGIQKLSFVDFIINILYDKWIFSTGNY